MNISFISTVVDRSIDIINDRYGFIDYDTLYQTLADIVNVSEYFLYLKEEIEKQITKRENKNV